MAVKDLGTNSTYFDAQDRSFETVVYRADAPVSNAELNLNQEIQGQALSRALTSDMASGFITGDLTSSVYSDFQFGNVPNEFGLAGPIKAHVAGMLVDITNTRSSVFGENLITLDPPPVNLGSIAVDFVFLEVWRALVEENPAVANKPSATEVYYKGNILSLAPQWLPEEIGDTPVGIANPAIETTRRVQIQYALRSIRMVSTANRIGYTDTAVFAQGPNLALTGQVFNASGDDPGLWVAGDAIGQPNAIAGTVDGYVYSIPVCLVFRRNSTAFNYLNNGNGGISGVGTANPSDRPDGFYSDMVTLNDIQDLRASVGPASRAWASILASNMELLLDNELRSFMGQGSHTGFYVGGSNEAFGTRILKADDILPSATADKPSGNTIRSFDGICRTFSARSVLEQHVIEYDAATNSGGGTWSAGDQVTLDLTAANLDIEQPLGTIILDVTSVRLNASVGIGTSPEFVGYSVAGLGTQTATITLDAPPTALSAADIWVTYVIQYPSGSGLTSMYKEEAANFNVVVHNPSSLNPYFTQVFTDDAAGRTALAPYLSVQYEQGPHREVRVEYHSDTTRTLATFSIDLDTVRLPDVAWVSDPANVAASFVLTVNGNAKTVTNFDVATRTITFSPAEASGDLPASVDYIPLRPLPSLATELTLYYLAPAIQAIPFEYLDNPADLVNHSLEVEPLLASKTMWTVTASAGSVVTPYPYEGGSQQIAVSSLIGPEYQSEAELNAPGPISIDDFDADVGALELPILVPISTTENITLQNPVDVIGAESLEYIDHYTTVAPGSYIPAAFAQSLSTPVEHKAFVGLLCKTLRETSWGPSGSVILLVMSQYFDYTGLVQARPEENRVSMATDFGAIAIYRLKNNPIVK